MIKLIPRVENSKAMIILSPIIALTLTALICFSHIPFYLEDIPVSSVFSHYLLSRSWTPTTFQRLLV